MSTYQVPKPDVPVRDYWPEVMALAVSFGTPVAAWFICETGSMFQRSGSVAVFSAAVAEFVSLQRANRKHVLNAIRVQEGKQPLAFSDVASSVGLASFIAGLAGTIVWGYGDLWKPH
jgi:hypothetical protein